MVETDFKNESKCKLRTTFTTITSFLIFPYLFPVLVNIGKRERIMKGCMWREGGGGVSRMNKELIKDIRKPYKLIIMKI